MVAGSVALDPQQEPPGSLRIFDCKVNVEAGRTHLIGYAISLLFEYTTDIRLEWRADFAICELRKIEVLRFEGESAVIGAGISDGELVSVSFMDIVTEGMKVKVKEPAE